MTNEIPQKKTIWRSLIDGLAAHACHSCPEAGGLEALEQSERKPSPEVPAASAVERLASEPASKIQR